LTRVIDQLGRPSLDVGQRLSVRTPGWTPDTPFRVHVRTLKRGQLGRGGARSRVDHIDVPVVGAVEVRLALAGERNTLPIRGPGWGPLRVASRHQVTFPA